MHRVSAAASASAPIGCDPGAKWHDTAESRTVLRWRDQNARTQIPTSGHRIRQFHTLHGPSLRSEWRRLKIRWCRQRRPCDARSRFDLHFRCGAFHVPGWKTAGLPPIRRDRLVQDGSRQIPLLCANPRAPLQTSPPTVARHLLATMAP